MEKIATKHNQLNLRNTYGITNVASNHSIVACLVGHVKSLLLLLQLLLFGHWWLIRHGWMEFCWTADFMADLLNECRLGSYLSFGFNRNFVGLRGCLIASTAALILRMNESSLSKMKDVCLLFCCLLEHVALSLAVACRVSRTFINPDLIVCDSQPLHFTSPMFELPVYCYVVYLKFPKPLSVFLLLAQIKWKTTAV